MHSPNMLALRLTSRAPELGMERIEGETVLSLENFEGLREEGVL